MAAEQAANCEVEALYGAVLAERFNGVLRAGGRKTAARRQQRRDAHAIKPDRQYQRFAY